MCGVCGCDQGSPTIDGKPMHGATAGRGAPYNFVPDPSGPRLLAPAAGSHGRDRVLVERDILSRNRSIAAGNRGRLQALGVCGLNLISSPGAGKTSLLARTAQQLRELMPVAVIEGDQATSNDADRMRAAGVPTVQINTGTGCHLDADMVSHGLDALSLNPGTMLFIENVGNLVCPALFDLGETAKVVILSVTEGEDKPIKYPDVFSAADLIVLSKQDLLPHVDFDVDLCMEYARRVNERTDFLLLSARTGEGIGSWIEWIHARRAQCAPAGGAFSPHAGQQ